MRALIYALAIGLGTAVGLQPQPQPPPLPWAERIVDLNITLNLPLGLCTVPSLMFTLAEDLEIPAGGEMLPGRCGSEEPSTIDERIRLLGMKLGDAFELLMNKDPRYRVEESNGVVVIRPLNEWINEKHFLHTMIDKLEFIDENIGGGLDAVLVPLRGSNDGIGSQIMSGAGKLSLSLGPISIVEGLDAIVRAHGAARWTVSYCLPEVAPDVATVYLHTYDNRGLGAPAARRRQVNGKPIVC